MTLRLAVSTCAVALALSACGHEFEPPDRAERVAEAAAQYSTALFDSIAWADEEARTEEGNEVYAEKCRRCHGPLGRGETAYARERGLQVPSLVEPDWPIASMDSLRRVIYVGHEEGMPGWGVAGIAPREIDSSAYYILNSLRPELLGGTP